MSNGKKKKDKRKYKKPVSLYPLKPDEALDAFMKVDPNKVKKRKKKEKGN
jgi:hypothetical protein